jgi:lysozyme family protein
MISVISQVEEVLVALNSIPTAPSVPSSMDKDKEFARCIPFIFEEEGGYVNHPSDPGGETNYGISKRAFPNLDIKNLTKKDAMLIYYERYWLFVADKLEWPLNLVVLDCAVNQGTGKAKRYLEMSKGDYKQLIDYRRQDYLRLAENTKWAKKFIRGWLNRLNRLRKYIDEKSS